MPKSKADSGKKLFVTGAVIIFLGIITWNLAWEGNLGDMMHQLFSIFQKGTQVYFQEFSYPGHLYGARITAFDSGSRISFGRTNCVAGSTFPDPGNYPIISAGSYYFQRRQHFGGLINPVFHSRVSPALIINPGAEFATKGRGGIVPTVNTNMSQFAGDNIGLCQASEIHVHAGFSQTLKGSYGCITIRPEDARQFFDSKIAFSGILHIIRPNGTSHYMNIVSSHEIGAKLEK